MASIHGPMAIPCIRVDTQDQDASHIENSQWSAYGSQTSSQVQDVFSTAPPFRLQTDLPIIDHYRGHQHQHFQQYERIVQEQHHEPMGLVMQSAPVREAPFEGVPWIPEPQSAMTPYHERLSSPDDTIHSSTSGSGYWPNQQWSGRFDSLGYSPASQAPEMSRRGSAFGSLSASAASEMQDPLCWPQEASLHPMPESHIFPDVASMGGASFASTHISRHTTPFNAQGMFPSTGEMDLDTRSSVPPPPQSHHSAHDSGVAFRYPSPYEQQHHHFEPPHFRASLTPAGTDRESDFDIPFKSDDCDSDYIPGRAMRSPRSRIHRQARSMTHIRRPSYNQHHRSSSYNNAVSTANKISKRQVRRPSSTSHIQYSPKISNRHASAHHHAHSSTSTIPPNAQQAPRPFTCPLQPYSCPKTFTSKNEWKRHVLTQHLLLGFWRCDLCPDAAARPNDFNRKDLFVQHLRRMHCGDRRGSASVFDEGSYIGETTEQALERVRRRCWIQLRKAPRRLACCFCNKTFESKESKMDTDQERERGCAVDWLEHVGRHLVALSAGPATGTPTDSSPAKSENLKGHRRKRSNGSNTSKSSIEAAIAEVTGEPMVKSNSNTQTITEPPWASDQLLLQWLIEEGLVEANQNQGINEKCQWILVDRGVASEAAMVRRASGEDEERDAEGEME